MRNYLLIFIGVILGLMAVPYFVIYTDKLELIIPIIFMVVGGICLGQKELFAKIVGVIALIVGATLLLAMIGPKVGVVANEAGTAMKSVVEKGDLFSPTYIMLGLIILILGVLLGLILGRIKKK